MVIDHKKELDDMHDSYEELFQQQQELLQNERDQNAALFSENQNISEKY